MILLLTQLAAAQDWPGGGAYITDAIHADPLRPALDPEALLITESAAIPEQFIARADLIHTHNPLIWISEEGDQVNLIGDVVGLHLAGGIGIGRLRLGAAAPMLRLFASEVHELPAVIAGDLVLSGKYALLQDDSLGLAALLSATWPLGAEDYQLGYTTASMDIGLAADGGDRLRWLANLGYRIQPDTQLEIETGTLTLADPLWLRGGIVLPIREPLSATGELSASLVPTAFALESTPVEALLGLQHHSARGRLLRGGVGIGLIGGIGAPSFRLMLGVGHDPGPPLVILPEETPPADPSASPAGTL